MARQHAEQFTGTSWQDMGHQLHVLEFRMVRSKAVFASMEVTKLQAMRKLNDLMNIESVQVKDALTSFIPF